VRARVVFHNEIRPPQLMVPNERVKRVQVAQIFMGWIGLESIDITYALRPIQQNFWDSDYFTCPDYCKDPRRLD
jgi:hypothetical protein